MRSRLWSFCLTLSIGAAWDARAQGPAQLPPSPAASALVGRWMLNGMTTVKPPRQAKHTATVTTTTIRCNACPYVLFLANGRGAFLTAGGQDTVRRFQWHVAQEVLVLRVVGPETTENELLPSGTYRLRVRGLQGMDLLDKRGVAYELTGGN